MFPVVQVPFDRVKDIYAQNPEFNVGPRRTGSNASRLSRRLSSIDHVPRLSTMDSLKLHSTTSTASTEQLPPLPISLSGLANTARPSFSPDTGSTSEQTWV
jgi:hypothetical protein